MANLDETAQWEAGIYQLETTDPVTGGPDGVDNLPHKLLANRTLYLKQQMDRLSIMGADLATVGGVLTLPDSGGYFVVTGAEPLTQISARAAGETVRLRWASTRAIQQNPAQLVLPNALSVTVYPGEFTEWISDGGGIWRLVTPRDCVGKIAMHGGATAPAGWLLCDGSAVSRQTYAGLFAVLGTTWGAGDGSTTFNLPDIRGRAPIGAGQGSGLTNRALGQTGGTETHALTIAELPAHTHEFFSSWGDTGYQVIQPASDLGRRKPHPDDDVTAYPTEATGGGGAHNNMQPFAVMLFIIKT
jgi:microcystin-dependent protein